MQPLINQLIHAPPIEPLVGLAEPSGLLSAIRPLVAMSWGPSVHSPFRLIIAVSVPWLGA